MCYLHIILKITELKSYIDYLKVKQIRTHRVYTDVCVNIYIYIYQFTNKLIKMNLQTRKPNHGIQWLGHPNPRYQLAVVWQGIDECG